MTDLNRDLERDQPAVWALLSELGREAIYPPDIPHQAAEAKGVLFNATIGQITDGAGSILSLPAIAEQLTALGGDLNAALLYSPVPGNEVLRRLWRERHRPATAESPSSLPLVVAGLSHGLSLLADLFCEPGRALVVPAPFWGNYRQIFGLRRGARLLPADVYAGGGFAADRLVAPLAQLPSGEPAVVLLNLPSNPVGYSPTESEREGLVEALTAAADRRPLLVVCDDAYAGLVYEAGIPVDSVFWDLAGRHPNLVPVKVDGCTKELVLFGGRVAFVSFAFAAEAPVSVALESKAMCLSRATIGSPVALSQELVVAALGHRDLEAQIAEVRRVLAGRYTALRRSLEHADQDLLRPLPFNSGCFALLELAQGVEPDALRRRLLERHDTGVVALAPRYLRIAYCSVSEPAIPELVLRVEKAIGGRS